MAKKTIVALLVIGGFVLVGCSQAEPTPTMVPEATAIPPTATSTAFPPTPTETSTPVPFTPTPTLVSMGLKPQPRFNMYLLTRDGWHCLLISDTHPSIERQNQACFPDLDPNWTAMNAPCAAPAGGSPA